MKHCINCGSKIKEEDGFCENCGEKVSSSIPLIISEKVEHSVRKPFYKKGWFFVSIVIFFVLPVVLAVVNSVFFSVNDMSSNTLDQTSTTLLPQTLPPAPSISNPDYLKDPSAYLVDKENKVSSSAIGKTLWVEEIIDSYTLKISYIEEKAGVKILILRKLTIPWLGDPTKDRLITKTNPSIVFSLSAKECWENGTKEFLKTHFLHTELYLNTTGWYPNRSFPNYNFLSYSDGTIGKNGEGLLYYDFSDYVIRNGYGGLGQPPSYSGFDSPEYKYHDKLSDIEGIASLAKYGLWGICQ